MKIGRRDCIALGLASTVTGVSSRLMAQQGSPTAAEPPKLVRPEPDRGVRQDLDLVKAFVQAGHSDKNIERVKEYLSANPKLVYAAWDGGGGDWETALNGASHIGSREMARFLLSKGARIDSFCAAMLGEREVLSALIRANSSVVAARGAHGYTLLYHVAISGDVAMAELLKPHLESMPAGIYTQALQAAVRDGHLAMTKWLFANGNVNPNVEDALGKRPLAMAVEKGYEEVAEELRNHGARESN